jgi:hypothetical protein
VILEEWSTGRRNRLWNPQRTQDQVKNSKPPALRKGSYSHATAARPRPWHSSVMRTPVALTPLAEQSPPYIRRELSEWRADYPANLH